MFVSNNKITSVEKQNRKNIYIYITQIYWGGSFQAWNFLHKWLALFPQSGFDFLAHHLFFSFLPFLSYLIFSFFLSLFFSFTRKRPTNTRIGKKLETDTTTSLFSGSPQFQESSRTRRVHCRLWWIFFLFFDLQLLFPFYCLWFNDVGFRPFDVP